MIILELIFTFYGVVFGSLYVGISLYDIFDIISYLIMIL